MDDCTCPDDWRKLPGMRRVVVIGPNVRAGGKPNDPGVAVYDKLCPKHGYKVLTEE